MPCAPFGGEAAAFRSHNLHVTPRSRTGKLTCSATCRNVAGDAAGEYRRSDPESSRHKTHGHTRRESTTHKARSPVLAFSRFTEKTVMTKSKILGAVTVAALLIAFGASADAATLHHYRTRHHHVASRFTNSFAYAAPRAETRYSTPSYNETPSYNDACKFGGSTALPAE